METLARVTLLEPFLSNGKPQVCRLVYGYGEARVISGSGDVVPGVSGDDLVDGGAHMGLMPRMLPRVIPGRPNEWNLTMEVDLAKRTGPQALVPLDAARLWFGNERLGKVSPMGTPTELTFNHERQRVATFWGYWKLPRKALNGSNACKRGENDFDLTKIGPPRIPNVEIVRLDQGGAPVGDPFQPWAWFQWENDVEHEHAESDGFVTPQSGGAGSVERFSIADLEAILAAKRAEEAKAAKRVPAGA